MNKLKKKPLKKYMWVLFLIIFKIFGSVTKWVMSINDKIKRNVNSIF